jgi:Rap1a immunity proteins
MVSRREDEFSGKSNCSDCTLEANDEKSSMHVCLPNELIGSQAVLIIEKFMKEHPEQLHYPAGVVAFYALWQDFPCSK